jgi:predicted AAA+ superfamily ATPase
MIKQHIELLKELYIITELKPYFTNKNKELIKISKIYFIDNGVRNYFLKNFIELKLRSDTGQLFESYIITELLKSKVDSQLIKYRNDKNQREIDLIIDHHNHIQPIEIKYKISLKSSDLSHVSYFDQQYQTTSIVINLDKQDKIYRLPFMIESL